MTGLRTLPLRFYDKVILRHPGWVLAVLALVAVILGRYAGRFRFDASSRTLVMEGDKDLQYARMLEQRYGSSEMLVIAFTPKQDLLSAHTLQTIRRIRDDLRQLGSLESVTTILDVPLLESPVVGLKELGSTIRTLESNDVDFQLARKELATSPLYSQLLVSYDLRTTAILMFVPEDRAYQQLAQEYDQLLDLSRHQQLDALQRDRLRNLDKQLSLLRDKIRKERHLLVTSIRSVMDRYRDEGQLVLGGVSMIADDMLTFIKKDLRIFGSAVFLLLVGTLVLIFRRARWVLLACLVCAISVLYIVGLLGWLGWEVTVISSNFISLQLIITLAMAIHIIVRYIELSDQRPYASQGQLLHQTIAAILRPCVYSGLTTVGGFASLISSNIRPVASFGKIMVLGVSISMAVPLLLLPAILMFLPVERSRTAAGDRSSLTILLARLTVGYGPWIMAVAIVVTIFNLLGIRRLQVENCFINYFKTGTEIRRGLRLIDQKLGGTTPLDVVIDFPSTQVEQGPVEDDLLAEFERADQQDYWFTPHKIGIIRAAHRYLDGLEQTGKVLSLATLVEMIERQNKGRPLDALELALLFKQVPQPIRDMLVRPYVSVGHNQARISVRILDSLPGLERKALLDKIKKELPQVLGVEADQIHLAGLLVLYNNMLQSLYSSQVLSLGLALLMLLLTFTILFRSITQALVAIVPNAFAISCVLGLMGWLNIPLDMMTITIAAIGVGLADDDTIHYMHRFRHELSIGHGYAQALFRAHASTGRAIYYTTVALMIGFSVLVLSNFVPSVYFGLLTGLAIFVALLASLTILPELILIIRPFDRSIGREGKDKPKD
ncbi:MAG: MMPL family transporter [Sedimentisphaerales bacterium]|jgi:predicted RND superfamily exporter protein|nr:MMPL family transporter [Sedimentisphaerales bacterium]